MALRPRFADDVDAVHERNAHLVVRLRRVQLELHEAAKHPVVFKWHRCQHPSCVATRTLVEHVYLLAETA